MSKARLILSSLAQNSSSAVVNGFFFFNLDSVLLALGVYYCLYA